MLERTEAMDAGAVEKIVAVLMAEDIGDPLRASKPVLESLSRRILAALTPSPSVPAQADEAPCRHEWYLGQCCHCEMRASEFRAAPSVPAPGSDKVEALAKRLEARTKQVLENDWQKGLKCPECGSNATRPKCFHDLGGGCPRHDPDNYEPSPWQTVPDEDCAEAASALRTLSAERDALAAWKREASDTIVTLTRDRDRLTADLGEAVKALEGAKADLLELAGSEEHLAPAVERIDVVLASLRARSEASHLERADLREKAGVDALARVLMEAWAKAEPDHPVTRFTASYVATFADMARAALASALAQREVRCEGCGSAWTDEKLAAERAKKPAMISCCPERKPLNIDQWRERCMVLEDKLRERGA